jgi:hypothetical protein
MDVYFFTLRIPLYNDKEGHLFVSKKSSLMDNSETQAVLGTRQLLSCIDY